jgi:hypothetical protein
MKDDDQVKDDCVTRNECNANLGPEDESLIGRK